MQKAGKLILIFSVLSTSLFFLISPLFTASANEELVSPLPKVSNFAQSSNCHAEFISASKGILKPIRQAQGPEYIEGQVQDDAECLISENKTLTKDFPPKINILLLGFDGRKGDKNPRCDAVHFFSYDSQSDKLEITTIPRGTEVTISKKEGVNYLSNICHYKGVDFTVAKIEELTGLKADYIVKIGFSQTLGILRYLNLPSVPTLQYLRNRSYGIGDWQRSHNQAVFLKDMLIKYFRQFSELPKPLQFILFQMVDTNMDFETATKLADLLLKSDLDKNPDQIILTTIPNESPYIKEIHYQVKDNNNWQNDKDYKEYQKNLSAYLENLLSRAENYLDYGKKGNAYKLIKTPFSQKLWYQIEDRNLRNDFYFRFLKIYAESADDPNFSSLILNFTTEMEAVGDKESKERGEELLSSLVRSNL